MSTQSAWEDFQESAYQRQLVERERAELQRERLVAEFQYEAGRTPQGLSEALSDFLFCAPKEGPEHQLDQAQWELLNGNPQPLQSLLTRVTEWWAERKADQAMEASRRAA